jgi:hypothetical protein
VAGAVAEIREGPRNLAQRGSRAIQVSAASAAHSPAYAGSVVLHEATHVRSWLDGDGPAFGCAGEARSLTAQAAYLETVGAAGQAAWVRGLIGVWC